jgi:hypothetical protein
MKLKRPRYCLETLRNILVLTADDPKSPIHPRNNTPPNPKETWFGMFNVVHTKDETWKRKKKKEPWE